MDVPFLAFAFRKVHPPRDGRSPRQAAPARPHGERHSPGATGWRGNGSAYIPEPDRRVLRSLRRLLNEPDPERRGAVALLAILALVLVILLAGIVW